MSNQRFQFSVLSRVLHWTMAAMVLAMLGIGVAMVASSPITTRSCRSIALSELPFWRSWQFAS